MYGISVPIRNRHHKVIAAINLTLPPSKAAEPGMLDYLLDELQQTASRINIALKAREPLSRS